MAAEIRGFPHNRQATLFWPALPFYERHSVLPKQIVVQKIVKETAVQAALWTVDQEFSAAEANILAQAAYHGAGFHFPCMA